MKAYIYSPTLNKTVEMVQTGVAIEFDNYDSAYQFADQVAGEQNNVNYLEVHDWQALVENT